MVAGSSPVRLAPDNPRLGRGLCGFGKAIEAAQTIQSAQSIQAAQSAQPASPASGVRTLGVNSSRHDRYGPARPRSGASTEASIEASTEANRAG